MQRRDHHLLSPDAAMLVSESLQGDDVYSVWLGEFVCQGVRSEAGRESFDERVSFVVVCVDEGEVCEHEYRDRAR